MKLFLYVVLLGFCLKLQAIEVHGHRGARSVYPENSLVGFSYAFKQNPEYIELDLHLSKDGVAMIHHDGLVNLNNCHVPKQMSEKYNKRMWLTLMDSEELKSIDCGKKNKKFKDQIEVKGAFIPSFEELILLYLEHLNRGNINTKLNIEFKIGLFKSRSYVRKLFNATNDILKKYNIEDRVMFQSFDSYAVRYAKKITPQTRVHFLSLGMGQRVLERIKLWGLDGISVRANAVRENMVEKYHMNNLRVLAWTENRASGWEYLLDLGVDGIITDSPEKLLEYLSREDLYAIKDPPLSLTH